ncbi:hypothetical protein Sango_1746900 [Sesamum angolense]|uniref:Reverse transcriptase domain-containing protein n=1 Tax=Sesamum angolense TaxID=2727404 RepID=A0AAE1WMD0_9LAMI|nr:hypothetical protein Sango_1746900 [Sesamum angolense]
MQKIFDDMLHKNVECYVDDLVVNSKKRENHFHDLRKVFERLRRYQLKMNPSKCAFGVTYGKFLGFIVRQRGIEIEQAKIDAILLEPRNIHELKSLQGKLAYLRRLQAIDSELYTYLPQDIVRGISRQSRHGRLFDKPHLSGSYWQMSDTVPCGQQFQFSCGGFSKIEFQWMRGCNKRDSTFHLNRNAAKYCGVPFSTNGIILEVQCQLHTLYAARTLTSTQWKGDLHRAGIVGFIFCQTVPRAPSIVRWHALPLSWFKLNTYGSSFRNPDLAGVAGIIRDSDGHVHLAYQVALGTGTSVLAELTAVWRGLELALTHSLAPLVVEVDATALISLLQSRISGKEANGAANHLAKEAASLQLTRVLHHNHITGVFRGILCLDRRGVPHLRRGGDGFTTWTRSFWRRFCG